MVKKSETFTGKATDAISELFPEEVETASETQETAQTEKTPTKEEIEAIVRQSAEIARKVGRPTERGETYRFSLYLDGDLKSFIDYRVWQLRQKSITTYLNNLIRQDMENYISEGGNADEWTDKD